MSDLGVMDVLSLGSKLECVFGHITDNKLDIERDHRDKALQ